MSGDPKSLESIKGAADDIRSAQWWLLFSCIVAGKNAEFATAALNRFLGWDDGLMDGRINSTVWDLMDPFPCVAQLLREELLLPKLHAARTGNYGKMHGAFRDIISLSGMGWGSDPREWSFDMLMKIPGVGPKTAAMYRLFINPRERVAALDTHVLKFLRECSVLGVPKSTPAWGPTYRAMQEEFLQRADKLGISPRDLDYFVWSVYRNGGKVAGL